MRRALLFAAAAALIAPLVTIAPASAAPPDKPERTRGAIAIDVVGLTSTVGTPSGKPTLVPTTGLEAPVTQGSDFSFSSIECSSGPAPFNEVGLEFTPDFPGLEDPAPIRSVVEGTVTTMNPSGGGSVEGTITTFLCEDGEETDQIVASFTARFRPTSDDQVVLMGGTLVTTGGLALNGRFTITEATGRFEGLTGKGRLRGQFTCLPVTLMRNDASDCEDLGLFSEALLDLDGRFATTQA
ncbi:hypothetical protein BH23ACT9_BH23ACT9_39960 [soil metagenome]